MPIAAPPTLELLSALPPAGRATADAPPLLFLHGAYCGAWVWQEFFLPESAARGMAAYAVSLRGHGASAGHDLLHTTGLGEYVEDLAWAVAEVTRREGGRAPLVVGHSMGGMVAQRWLERQDGRAVASARSPLAGLVLMGSVPPGGLWGTTVQLALADPLALWQLAAIQAFGERAATVQGLQRAMFGGVSGGEALTRRYLHRMQDESWRVQMDLTLWPPPVAANGRAVPMLVIGADHDSFVPPWMAAATARHYDAELIVLPDTGHAMMLGHTWRMTLDTLLAWMERRDLLRPAAA